MGVEKQPPSFKRRDHGSERRGVFSVPADSNALTFRREQSKQSKARVLAKYQEIQRSRIEELQKSDLGNKSLPAYKHKQEIIANIDAYKAVILGGPTGSGKSTQLPQYLYEAGYDKTIVLVPRRIIADGLGERIREEFKDQLGIDESENIVGIVHGERVELHDDNRVMVMTPNTFNRMEKDLSEKYGNKKVAIISDEIHEANLFTEIATGIAAMAVQEHDQWRLVAASATHNSESLQKSFQALNKDSYVPMINIEGRPFNVDMKEEPGLNLMEVYAKVGKEHEKTMLFTSGKREIDHIIEQTIAELDKNDPFSSKSVVFRKLHGELSEFELSHIDDPIPEGSRLVIVSSPAGMSGITIPGVTLVVTDGTINRQELDEDGIPGLVRHYLSKDEVIQQIGRAGRDVPGGIGYIADPTTVMDDELRKRGKEVEIPQMEYLPFEEREQHAPPEIYHTNLSRVVLSVAVLDLRFGEINEYIPHSVSPSAIINAEESLSRLGALNDEDKITKTGKAMDEFPISPELSRGLVEMQRAERVGERTAQHLARSAFIAAAVETGGLQDFTAKKPKTWRALIRPEVTDDFIAQLDLMTAVQGLGRLDPKEAFDFMDKYSIHPKRLERAQKVTRKILQAFKMSQDNIIVTAPLPDEEALMRSDFTAGMIDLVYEEAGKSYRKTLYKNIHGDETATKRLISQRSVSEPSRGQLVAGIPRWYEKQSKDGVKRFDVIEMTLMVEPSVVGHYALQNDLLMGRLLSPQMDGDRIAEREQMMFGTIPVGAPVKSDSRELIPKASQEVLVERVLEKPGDAQRALRSIADELQWYKNAFPDDMLADFRKTKSPEDITKESIKELVKNYAQHTRTMSEIERRLSELVYRKNITIHRYFDESARRELQRLSPGSVEVRGVGVLRVLYENGTPYFTRGDGLTEAQFKIAAANRPTLPDGREILFQTEKTGGGAERVSAHVFLKI
ncbi:DEAD/DEAH box helicase family protein [Candidatus Saccharibacteria bacterium]|nr:DEAD/DEAH box helicase family protein [Candidatus Saccharibacteria bacterium]